MNSRQFAKIAKRVGFWALIAVIMVYAVFPFYYAVITSVKPSSDLFRVELWPSTWNLDNYAQIFSQSSFVRAIFNSIIVAFSVVFIALLLGITASYALGGYAFGAVRRCCWSFWAFRCSLKWPYSLGCSR